MPESPHLRVDIGDGILTATLAGPDDNALTGEMMASFEQALRQFRDDPAIKLMLIRAAGPVFCAGAVPGAEARKASASAIREALRLQNRHLHRIFDEMEHIEKPLVLAAHGLCAGAGLELALSCDFRLAAQSAVFAFPESEAGILPASNGISRLTRICGPHWARWLVMANLPADAAMAYTMGLVHKVWPDDLFEAKLAQFCTHLAKQNGEQMGAAKIAIELAVEVGRDSARHVERMTNSALMLNPDYAERIGGYIQKIGGKSP